jgi:squalene-hopene/tetraprenyl-beta-curcumene cyclase
MIRRVSVLLAVIPLVILTALPGSTPGQPKGGKSRDKALDEAVKYLTAAQAEDGSWSKASSPGVTAIALTGLLKTGKVKADDPVATKALKFIEGMADEKDGNLAGTQRLKNYITSVNLIALKTTGLAKYKALTTKAATYLKNGQRGAEDGLKPTDINFGGFGYNSTTRADLSNTHFVLDSLKAAGTSKDDPVYRRAAVFISRCQNLKSEFNTQPWAGKIDDGSFIYVLPQPGGKGNVDDPRPGYGSMTAAGVKGLIQCGISKDDQRVMKGLKWLAQNYSVDVNPGRQDGSGGQGYYYYLLALAECFESLREDEFTDANGKKHDWRADITRALVNRQKKDGSWANDFGTWMESDPNLCTGYALQTLAVCKPKAK